MKKMGLFLAIILLLLNLHTGQAQQYLEGNKVPSTNSNDLLVYGVFNLENSTDVFFQLMQKYSLDPEVIEPVFLNLYEPDLSLISNYEINLPSMQAQLNYWAGGLKLVNSLVEDSLRQFLVYKYSVYDSAYVSQFTDEEWSVFVGVLDENGDSLFTVLSNYHGFETFELDGQAKLAVNRLWSRDTAYYEGGGWFTTYVYTGHIYDLSSGELELQMPHGIMYEGITFAEGQKRILGRNNNIAAMYEDLYNDFDILLYNLDGSLYKTAIDSLSDYRTGDFYYFPAVDKYYMKEKYGKSIYSIPDYETIANGDIFFDSQGKAKVVDYNDTLVTIYNEDLTVYKSLGFEDDGMHSVVWVNMHDIISDDKIEIVRECPNGGLQIFTEDGDTIIDNWDLKLVDDFEFSNSKIVLRYPDEAFGRLITTNMMDFDHFFSYYKVGRISVYTQTGDTPGTDDVELLTVGDNGFIVLDTTQLHEGYGEFIAGEGKYVLRNIGKQQEGNLWSLNSYFPGELLWENAEVIPFYTSEMDLLVLNIQTVDLSPIPGAEGVIRGTIRENDATLRSIALPLPSYQLYLVEAADHSQVKSFTQSDAGGDYQFGQIAAGTYDVLLNIEGKAMNSVNTVVLSANSSTVENVDYVITEEGIVAAMQNSIEKHHQDAVNIYLINQGNTLFLSGAEGTIHLRIVDLSGRILLKTQSTQHQLDISGLQAGLYLLEVRSGNEKQVLKFRKR